MARVQDEDLVLYMEPEKIFFPAGRQEDESLYWFYYKVKIRIWNEEKGEINLLNPALIKDFFRISVYSSCVSRVFRQALKEKMVSYFKAIMEPDINIGIFPDSRFPDLAPAYLGKALSERYTGWIETADENPDRGNFLLIIQFNTEMFSQNGWPCWNGPAAVMNLGIEELQKFTETLEKEERKILGRR
ncbi:MAG: hypothetical protein GXO71_06260 [Caldiserica bacterium]|nr:hypothetical protein [Caldisericota bacterium]